MSKPKGTKQGAHRKHAMSTSLLMDGRDECICGCGRDFQREKFCNGAFRQYFDDSCRNRRKHNRIKEISPEKHEQGVRAAAASKAKRLQDPTRWRDPQFDRLQVCHYPSICAKYDKCSDQSIIGGLWEHEANGGEKCWTGRDSGLALQAGINREVKLHFRHGARMGAE